MDVRLSDIRKRVARDGEALPSDIDELDDILEAEGPSVDALILRGQLIQLVDGEDSEVFDEAFACFQEAVELDPTSADAFEELAHFMDDVADEPEEAEAFFRKAIELGAGETAREGLRDVLRQLGRADD
jgi:tetratricopeptide (TPR) repeat protein